MDFIGLVIFELDCNFGFVNLPRYIQVLPRVEYSRDEFHAVTFLVGRVFIGLLSNSESPNCYC